jgi:hypothetical protein
MATPGMTRPTEDLRKPAAPGPETATDMGLERRSLSPAGPQSRGTSLTRSGINGGYRSAAGRTPVSVGAQDRYGKVRKDLGSPERRNLGPRSTARTRVTQKCHNSRCQPQSDLGSPFRAVAHLWLHSPPPRVMMHAECRAMRTDDLGRGEESWRAESCRPRRRESAGRRLRPSIWPWPPPLATPIRLPPPSPRLAVGCCLWPTPCLALARSSALTAGRGRRGEIAGNHRTAGCRCRLGLPAPGSARRCGGPGRCGGRGHSAQGSSAVRWGSCASLMNRAGLSCREPAISGETSPISA